MEWESERECGWRGRVLGGRNVNRTASYAGCLTCKLEKRDWPAGFTSRLGVQSGSFGIERDYSYTYMYRQCVIFRSCGDCSVCYVDYILGLIRMRGPTVPQDCWEVERIWPFPVAHARFPVYSISLMAIQRSPFSGQLKQRTVTSITRRRVGWLYSYTNLWNIVVGRECWEKDKGRGYTRTKRSVKGTLSNGYSNTHF